MAETETVYGTQDDSRVMSERVQTLAASIYKEFERMLNKYDEDVVKELMPLVVGILENLDLSYQEKQENEVELELIRDDNEQLLTQYEREKQLRKGSEQKLLEVEDATEEENKELQSKLESLESIVRMFELKAKNAQDHISRLEDKESEMKREYTKLHDRYTELFKTHMEHIDRTKMIMGADRIMEMANSPRGRGFQLPNLRPVGQVTLYNSGDTPGKPEDSLPGFGPTTPSRTVEVNASLKQELGDLEKSQLENSLDVKQRKSRSSKTCTTETGQITDSIDVKEISTGTKHTSQQPQSVLAVSNATEHAQQHDTSADVVVKATTPEVVSEPGLVHAVHTDSTSGLCITQAGLDDILQTPELEDIDESGFGRKSASEFKKSNNESSIFDEVTFQDVDALGEIDDGHDITGKVVLPGDYASSGMSKEVENLILENTELLATKNALNVVKDDLIAKVDELTSEQEILREEINSLQTAREKLKKRVAELEEDLKKTKENLEKEKHKAVANPEEEDDVPMAQRKRFTRVEMARVLMERNQYKERLMELQEAVRWTEMIRASREHPDIMQSSKKKSSLWNFFSNLFSSSNKPPKRPTSTATVRYSAPTTNVRPVGDPKKKKVPTATLR